MRAWAKWSVQLPIVFGVVVVSFITATFFTQWQLFTVGGSSREIADNFAPSIEHLASARGEMGHVQIALREYVDDQSTGAPAPPLASVDAAREAMDTEIADYLALPSDAIERHLWGDMLRAKDALNRAVEMCLAQAQRDDIFDARLRMHDVSVAADTLGAAITRAIELNAARSHDAAVRIEHVHERSTYIAFALATICAAIAVGGAIGLKRAVNAHTALTERHSALVEARAFELEEFAGRVAHDIMSPLSVVSMALPLSISPGIDDATRAQFAERGMAAIKRTDRLVAGLLAFAVAGARPEQGARTDVKGVVADLAPELRAAAKDAGAQLNVAVDVSSPIACHAGVLTSLISNLARNAIKYVGTGPTRRIDIRASEGRRSVRIEVQDTGPGLSPDLEPRVFEPYVRGRNATKPGIGLGLATVKRIATAHGGTVGVKSVPGAGCTFWVELPKAHAA